VLAGVAVVVANGDVDVVLVVLQVLLVVV